MGGFDLLAVGRLDRLGVGTGIDTENLGSLGLREAGRLADTGTATPWAAGLLAARSSTVLADTFAGKSTLEGAGIEAARAAVAPG